VEKIIADISKLPNGEKKIFKQYKNLNFEINIKWNRKKIYFSIKYYRFSFELADFRITRDPFMSFIARYPNYSLYGKSSKTSNKVLSNKYAIKLLEYKNPEIKFDKGNFSFKCRLKRRNLNELETITLYFKKLSDDVFNS